jgi:prevent-host-death family protein
MTQVFNATKAKSNFGEVIMASMTEPVFIEKNGKKVSVVISCSAYEKLMKSFEELEDLEDYLDAVKASAEHKKSGGKGVSWEEIKGKMEKMGEL